MSYQQVSVGPLAPPSFGTVSFMPCKLRWRCAAAEGIFVFTPAVLLVPMLLMLSSVTWCKTWCFAQVKCLGWKLLDSAKLWWRPKCLSQLVRSSFAETRRWPLRTAAAAFTVFWTTSVPPVLHWRSATVTQRKESWGGRRATGSFFVLFCNKLLQLPCVLYWVKAELEQQTRLCDETH